MGVSFNYYENKNVVLRSFSRSWRTVIGIGFSIVAVTIGSAAVSNLSHAAPNLSCSPHGYIVRDGTGTDVQAVDMVTGQGSPVAHVDGRHLNAIGYNPKDNHFYAWDLQNGVFVKANSDFSTVTPYTAASMGYVGPTTTVFSGDVDEDGYHWSFTVSGGTTTWYRINLNTPTPTFVESGTTPNPVGSDGTDWAYMPGTNSLYRGMDNGGGITIVAFNRTSKTFSTVGAVANITSPADGDMGSIYADPNNHLYMSSHNSGKLFRVDLSDAAPFTAVELDAVDPNSNDGARCALASVPVDLGDAPSSYSTLIADPSDGGARHAIINFNLAQSSAPLMLGNHVDIEIDGLPSSDATGDDADHEGEPGGDFVDDERGVTHIVANEGSTDPLVVPVSVANAGSQAAILAGWIDLDNDGTFEAAERVSTSVAGGFVGVKQLTFPTPPAPYSTNTFSRFRIFSATDTSAAATNLLPTGPAAGGEVEDVQVQIGTYEVSKKADPAEGTIVNAGDTITYTLTIKNTGSASLTNLKIDDDLTDVLDDATLKGAPMVSPSSAGSANVAGNTLEFVGDVGVGATVTVTYSVVVKESVSLGNAALNNFLLAAHSTNCHPEVSGDSVTVSADACQTSHPVGGLADTGFNVSTLLWIAGGMLIASGALMYFRLRHGRSVI